MLALEPLCLAPSQKVVPSGVILGLPHASPHMKLILWFRMVFVYHEGLALDFGVCSRKAFS